MMSEADRRDMIADGASSDRRDDFRRLSAEARRAGARSTFLHHLRFIDELARLFGPFARERERRAETNFRL